MGVVMPARLAVVCVPSFNFMVVVVVMVIVTMRMVMVMIVPMPMIMVMVVVIVIVTMPMIVIVPVMMMVSRVDIDVELGRRDPAPIDPLDAERESFDAQLLELGLEQFKVEAKVEHRADEHIAADAGETVEVESSGHSAYSKVPATMVVITSGWMYLWIAWSTSSLVTALTISGKRSR